MKSFRSSSDICTYSHNYNNFNTCYEKSTFPWEKIKDYPLHKFKQEIPGDYMINSINLKKNSVETYDIMRRIFKFNNK